MTEHYCTEKCNCPECGHPCHYSPRLNLHACSNVVYCRWKEELPDWRKQADALDLKSRDSKNREGSIPSSGTIKPNDRVRMKYFDRYAYGTVTIVSEQGCKVLFDGDYDLAYWYYPASELEKCDGIQKS